MWLARYYPGLGLGLADVEQMTPEETNRLRTVGAKLLKGEAEERMAHTKMLATVMGGRVF